MIEPMKYAILMERFISTKKSFCPDSFILRFYYLNQSTSIFFPAVLCEDIFQH